MAMQAVKSSFLSAIGYDEINRALIVEMKNGVTYLYDDVPAPIHAEMMAAESVGKFYASRIKAAFTGVRMPTSPELAAR